MAKHNIQVNFKFLLGYNCNYMNWSSVLCDFKESYAMAINSHTNIGIQSRWINKKKYSDDEQIFQ